MAKTSLFLLLLWLSFDRPLAALEDPKEMDASVLALARKEKAELDRIGQHADQTLAEQEEIMEAIRKAKAWLG